MSSTRRVFIVAVEPVADPGQVAAGSRYMPAAGRVWVYKVSTVASVVDAATAPPILVEAAPVVVGPGVWYVNGNGPGRVRTYADRRVAVCSVLGVNSP